MAILCIYLREENFMESFAETTRNSNFFKNKLAIYFYRHDLFLFITKKTIHLSINSFSMLNQFKWLSTINFSWLRVRISWVPSIYLTVTKNFQIFSSSVLFPHDLTNLKDTRMRMQSWRLNFQYCQTEDYTEEKIMW